MNSLWKHQAYMVKGRSIFFSIAWLGTFLCALLTGGCGNGGGQGALTHPPPTPSCTGATLSGKMLDSLTGKPVFSGISSVQAGSQLGTTNSYTFVEVDRAPSGADGSFSVCASLPSGPSAVVLVASDSAGNAYPPFVSAIKGSTDLGRIAMGGCTLVCAPDLEAQTSKPATISGSITSSPTPVSGRVQAEFVVQALDGATALWSLAVPTASGNDDKYVTASGSCAVGASACSIYSFSVPSQNPVRHLATGDSQQLVTPTYLLYADTSSSCVPPFSLSAFQLDGKSFLTADPGANLNAKTVAFASCH